MVYSAGAVLMPSISNVSFSISRVARLASFLNENGCVYPCGAAPKASPTRLSNVLSKFIYILNLPVRVERTHQVGGYAHEQT